MPLEVSGIFYRQASLTPKSSFSNMGSCSSSSSKNAHGDDSRHRAYSFHENLVRERTGRNRFDKIYEVVEEIGHGGLCTIFKIRKRGESIGGSARKLDKGTPWHRLKPEGFVRKKDGTDLRGQDKEVLFALKVINLSLVQVSKLCRRAFDPLWRSRLSAFHP